MVPVADDDEQAETAERGARTERGAGGGLLLGLGVVVVVLLAALVWQFLEAGNARDRVDTLEARLAELDDAGADRAAVADVAGRFGVALLTYDYQDLNAARQRVLALATTRFGDEYTDAFVNGLDDAITQFEAVADATLLDVYVAEVRGDSAKAVVTLDSEVRSTEGTRRTVSSYLDLRLVREDGQWRVDVATSLAALDQDQTPAPGTDPAGTDPTTTTIVPAPSG
jgi:Mce-associated membrane protein